jgi:hypothetical protein
MPVDPYPAWRYYPARSRPPEWVRELVGVFGASQSKIDSRAQRVKSDSALAALRPHLEALGFQVEAGKKDKDKIRRPVLFGEFGTEALAYEVDAFNERNGVALEVEAGRGARSNAVYRDLIQTSLLVDARFLALAVQLAYRHKSGGKDTVIRSYRDTSSLLDAIFASRRLALPLEGILLVGY